MKYELIKAILSSDVNMCDIKWVYEDEAYYFRVKNSCYKSQVSKDSNKAKIISELIDCSSQYNSIRISDNTYVDGFIFPESLEEDDDDDKFASNIFTKKVICLKLLIGWNLKYQLKL